jgi:nucleotide-binding universal stress UspA family protein
MARIVVGVDGSEQSRAALRWALAEARLRDADVRAVYAWAFPIVPGREFAPALAIPLDELRAEANELIDTVVAEEVGDETDVRVTHLAIEGSAADVLVDASRNADLLVVGSRGHGGFAGLLLGSVSQQCAHHAACPVVIVRPQPDA